MSTRDDRTRQSMPAPEPPVADRPDAATERHPAPVRYETSDHDAGTRPASVVKTSVAAAFALALGVAALLLVLTVVLSPVGLVLGLVGLVLGIVGIRAARHPARTGKAVAITGLVLSVLALLLVVAAAVGLVTFLSDPAAADQLQQQFEQLRQQVPGLASVTGS